MKGVEKSKVLAVFQLEEEKSQCSLEDCKASGKTLSLHS